MRRSSTSPMAALAELALSNSTAQKPQTPQLVCWNPQPSGIPASQPLTKTSQVYRIPIRRPTPGHYLRQVHECRSPGRRDGWRGANLCAHPGPDHVISSIIQSQFALQTARPVREWKFAKDANGLIAYKFGGVLFLSSSSTYLLTYFCSTSLGTYWFVYYQLKYPVPEKGYRIRQSEQKIGSHLHVQVADTIDYKMTSSRRLTKTNGFNSILG